MPRKPDRFERRLRNRMAKYYWPEQIASFSLDDCGMSGAEVVKELRKEHRWVERMVKDIAQDYESSVGDTAAEMLRDEILARLKQRRK